MIKARPFSSPRLVARPQLDGIMIPPRPEALVKAMEACQQPYPDANFIAKAISGDVGLSAAALKVANSPLYRVSNPITSIQQAVAFLGVKRVVAIVQIVSIKFSMANFRAWNGSGTPPATWRRCVHSSPSA